MSLPLAEGVLAISVPVISADSAWKGRLYSIGGLGASTIPFLLCAWLGGGLIRLLGEKLSAANLALDDA